MKSLDEISDEFIQNTSWLPKSHDGKLEMDCFKAGFTAAIKHLSEGVEFDSDSTMNQAREYADEASPTLFEEADWHTILRTGYLGGAKTQFERDVAAIGLAEQGAIEQQALSMKYQTALYELTQRADGLVEAVDKIIRNPKYTSQIAIAAWEQALAEWGKK
jgi:hypothetical protein